MKNYEILEELVEGVELDPEMESEVIELEQYLDDLQMI